MFFSFTVLNCRCAAFFDQKISHFQLRLTATIAHSPENHLICVYTTTTWSDGNWMFQPFKLFLFLYLNSSIILISQLFIYFNSVKNLLNYSAISSSILWPLPRCSPGLHHRNELAKLGSIFWDIFLFLILCLYGK